MQMILYLVAKWMEERKRLSETIREAEGDVTYLVLRKEQVEEKMVKHTHLWLNGELPNVDPDLLLLPEIVPDIVNEEIGAGR